MADEIQQFRDYVENNDLVGIQYLLNNGMNPNKIGNIYPSYYVITRRRNEIAKIIINDPRFDPNIVINIGEDRLTVLHHAVDRNMIDVVELLLQKGADVNGVDIQTNNTPLHFAMGLFVPNYEMINLLLIYGADRTIKNIYNRTPEESARRFNDQIANYIRDWAELPEIKEPADYNNIHPINGC